jgi:hypothetical protein
MFRKRLGIKLEFLRGAQRQEIPIRVMYRLNQTKRFADEYLAGKFFDQKICSPHRDVGLCNKRRHRSLLPFNTARHARDNHASHRDWVKGEENEEDDSDDCWISADCLVHGSIRSRFRASRQSPPSRPRQRAIPRHQRLCGAGAAGVVGLQLRWWNVGTGRSLIGPVRLS